MRKLFKEFKDFINRGSVLDLAVGMIIGSAFTAIVSALVGGILTPLINWIPGADGTGALQTVLREAVLDAEGNVITSALILDWGSVISAVITFICTALVLFMLIKVFNKLKDTGSKVKGKAEEKFKKDAPVEEEAAEAPAEEAPAEETAAENVETEEASEKELLKQILEVLKEKQ